MLHPIVLSYDDLPEYVEEDASRRCPELAVLSAMAHPSLDNATHALSVVRSLVEERSRLYCDLILKALADAHGASLEALMVINGYQYQSDFARRYVAEGREQGRSEAEAEQLALLRSIASSLVRGKLGERGEPLTLPDDGMRLSSLIVELGQAMTPQQVHEILERAAR